MARRREGGCLAPSFAAGTVLAGVVFGPALFSTPVLLGWAMTADPAQFRHDLPYWCVALACAVLLAAALVAVTGSEGTTARRVARRTPVLLVATTLAALAPSLPEPYRPSTASVFSVAGAALAVLAYWGICDSRRARREQVEPATVEQVRQVTTQTRHALRRVRAENDRIERLLQEMEAKLALARLEMSFAELRHFHQESRLCADQAHQRYRSTDDVLARLARTDAGVKIALRRTMLPGRGRPDRAAYATEAAAMAAARLDLLAQVERGRFMVGTLNQRTEALKYRIRDDCGARGERWYADLMARRDAARAAEGR